MHDVILIAHAERAMNSEKGLEGKSRATSSRAETSMCVLETQSQMAAPQFTKSTFDSHVYHNDARCKVIYERMPCNDA